MLPNNPKKKLEVLSFLSRADIRVSKTKKRFLKNQVAFTKISLILAAQPFFRTIEMENKMKY